MNKLTEFFSSLLKPVEILQPGIYHYQAPLDSPDNYRLHLRLEPDGSGLLVINASTVLHLNQTAAEYAYHIVKQTPKDEAISIIQARYNTKKEEIESDFEAISEQIDTLIHTVDLEPVSYLDLERQAPYSVQTSAPYRLDCALTYRLPEGAPTEAAPTKRVDRELSTEEWKTIINKSWAAGIPHLLFTGGEPTLREDLVELVLHAEQNGQVTGLLTNGLKLGDTKYLQALLEAGLDHAMILLEPTQQESWESLASFSYWSETLEDDIFVSVHLTITEGNQESAFELIDKLASTGVSAISLSTNNMELIERLEQVREHVDELDIESIWDIPVPYSTLNPVSLELETADEDDKEETLEGAGRGWLYVEPDGDVLPGQGINQVLGNLLNDDWETIWEKAKA
jgi:organic radical activating enzyme